MLTLRYSDEKDVNKENPGIRLSMIDISDAEVVVSAAPDPLEKLALNIGIMHFLQIAS
jgi:hypothetical protein